MVIEAWLTEKPLYAVTNLPTVAFLPAFSLAVGVILTTPSPVVVWPVVELVFAAKLGCSVPQTDIA
jgi:hypothetical protein